ncbi:MAG TPA: 6-bladed beta-propeller [Candidatus Aquicultor sp.]
MIGTTGILYYSLSNTSHNNTPNQQDASPASHPKYIGSIKGEGDDRLKAPMAVTVADTGLFVADSGNSKLDIFTQTGTLEQSVKIALKSGSNYPVGVAVDMGRRIYVSTIGTTGRIVVYNAHGTYLYTFPDGASNDASVYAAPVKPIAIYAANRKLYTTDVIDQDVKVYDYSGKLVTRFGRPGSEKGEFLYPNGIAADKDGTIFVSDSNNARIQVFSSKGEFLYQFSGTEKNSLSLPRGIAFDNTGRIHVVDTFKHKVFVFTKKGNLLFTYGGFGSDDGKLAYPNGIAIDAKTGTIFIADKLNNRITMWR